MSYFQKVPLTPTIFGHWAIPTCNGCVFFSKRIFFPNLMYCQQVDIQIKLYYAFLLFDKHFMKIQLKVRKSY